MSKKTIKSFTTEFIVYNDWNFVPRNQLYYVLQ